MQKKKYRHEISTWSYRLTNTTHHLTAKKSSNSYIKNKPPSSDHTDCEHTCIVPARHTSLVAHVRQVFSLQSTSWSSVSSTKKPGLSLGHWKLHWKTNFQTQSMTPEDCTVYPDSECKWLSLESWNKEEEEENSYLCGMRSSRIIEHHLMTTMTQISHWPAHLLKMSPENRLITENRRLTTGKLFRAVGIVFLSITRFSPSSRHIMALSFPMILT